MNDPTRPKLRWRRWAWLSSKLAGSLLLFYGVFLILGFWPVNRAYRAPPAEECVRLFIRSNEIHTDLVLPVVHEGLDIDWRRLFPPTDVRGNVAAAKYVAIGWGARGFFLETPRWADLKVSTLLRALFTPSPSVLHVEYLDDVAESDDMPEIRITREQYRDLANFVKASAAEVSEGGAAKTASEVTYGDSDRFYVSTGRYHLFNTCNQWTGRGLKRAGVPTGIWTPLKVQVLCWLPNTGTTDER